MNKTKGFTKYKKMRYMPGLDGLRAIAVLGIIIYHLNKQWLTGGFLGVDTFFVISGYLITSLLLKEYDDTNWIYDGGFYLISILTLFIIASVVHPSTWIAKIFSNPVLVFIGKRSYSLYLWHFAVISFVHSYYVDGQIPVYVYFIDISLTIIFAELSYRFIETPFRKEGIKALNWRSSYIPQFIRMVIVVTLLIPFMLILVGAFNKYGKDIIGEKANSFDTTIEDNYSMRIAPIDNIHIDGLVSEKKKESSDVYNNIKPLLIGDSVMVDIGESFKSSVPKSRIDGKVGRQLYQTLPLVKANYSQYKKSSDQVVLELGTNGDFTVKQLDDLLNQFGKAKIYLVNTRVPRIYEANVNRLLADAAKRKSNVTLIDWYKRSQGHSEYFAPDGVHLEYKGVLALKDEILKALKKK
ncbi:acetyltransferase [Staphylococcus aureus]|nr:acetyltransferase [Staphylococcus aureus]MCC1439845.1 acetyltransferase [Staphylococcus aureus]HCZ1978870.1 acetyltransferase [Staphylococcus aureus]HEI6650103.1 acetyltransferase [Staphylococcus aureus]